MQYLNYKEVDGVRYYSPVMFDKNGNSLKELFVTLFCAAALVGVMYLFGF